MTTTARTGGGGRGGGRSMETVTEAELRRFLSAAGMHDSVVSTLASNDIRSLADAKLLSTEDLKECPVLTRASQEPPHRTYGLRIPASCTLCVPRLRAACVGRGATVRAPYAYQPRACRTYRVPWHHRS